MGDVVQIVVGTITQFLSGIGAGLSGAFSRIFYETEISAGTDGIIGTADDVVTVLETISPLAKWGLVFLGIGVAMGLFYALFNLIRRR